MRPVVDTHLHLWDLQRLDYPWLAGLGELERSHEIGEAALAVPASRSVMVQADCRADQGLAEVAWVEEQAERGRGLGMDVAGIVAFAPVEGPGLAQHLDALAEHPRVVGVRRLLQGEPYALLGSDELVAGLRLLGERGLVFDVCVDADQLSAVGELVRRVPGTRFVLDHLGKPPLRSPERRGEWLASLQPLAAQPHVVCKLSGLAAQADPGQPLAEQAGWYLDRALELFGAERCLVGSDWPVSGVEDHHWWTWVRLVLQALADASEDETTAVLSGTATEVYALAAR